MRRAFTLIEMLVVVGLIAVLVTVAVPAFSGMLYSSNKALAENGLRIATTLARDASYASLTGGDGVAVFTTDEFGRTRIVAGEIFGGIEDADLVTGGGALFGADGTPIADAVSNDRVTRDVVAPVAFAETVTLPRFFSVRGFAPPTSLVNGWYTQTEAYSSEDAFEEGNWVGVEDNLYDRESQWSDGTPRQSFAIRYSSTTGKIVTSAPPMLVLDPRPSDEERDDLATGRSDVDNAWKRVDFATELSDWTRQALGREGTDVNGDGTLQVNNGQLATPGSSADFQQYVEIIGNRSHDTVLTGTVGRLALFDQRLLARGIGARGVNSATESIYQPWNSSDDSIGFDLDTSGDARSLFEAGVTADDVRTRINAWINGDTNRDDVIDEKDEPEARIFMATRYTGELTEAER